MAFRKFFYGDPVQFVGTNYSAHEGHHGVIKQTRIFLKPTKEKPRDSRISYTVDCGCGKTLYPQAFQIEPV
jgi:hypothetical protein